jgi:hypothetical protein
MPVPLRALTAPAVRSGWRTGCQRMIAGLPTWSPGWQVVGSTGSGPAHVMVTAAPRLGSRDQRRDQSRCRTPRTSWRRRGGGRPRDGGLHRKGDGGGGVDAIPPSAVEVVGPANGRLAADPRLTVHRTGRQGNRRRRWLQGNRPGELQWEPAQPGPSAPARSGPAVLLGGRCHLPSIRCHNSEPASRALLGHPLRGSSPSAVPGRPIQGWMTGNPAASAPITTRRS